MKKFLISCLLASNIVYCTEEIKKDSGHKSGFFKKAAYVVGAGVIVVVVKKRSANLLWVNKQEFAKEMVLIGQKINNASKEVISRLESRLEQISSKIDAGLKEVISHQTNRFYELKSQLEKLQKDQDALATKHDLEMIASKLESNEQALSEILKKLQEIKQGQEGINKKLGELQAGQGLLHGLNLAALNFVNRFGFAKKIS